MRGGQTQWKLTKTNNHTSFKKENGPRVSYLVRKIVSSNFWKGRLGNKFEAVVISRHDNDNDGDDDDGDDNDGDDDDGSSSKSFFELWATHWSLFR